MAKIEGNFLEANLPAQAFATLETFHQTAQYRLDSLFSTWIKGVQAHNRVTLGWIKSVENEPQPHIHAALIAAAPLDCTHAATLWRAMIATRYSKAAEIEPYRRGLCGLGYLLKRLGNATEDIQFSDNITSFAATGGESLFRTNSAERRQHRRIKVQFNRDSNFTLNRSSGAFTG
jgi:hypothetical protein